MAALKLFISHSSRLRPASADGAEAQANWQLLQDTCTGLKTEYGDKIEILVDYEGLHPGDDWERRLNEWLAECHAAIILFSRRAIEESNWVRKEAAILSWRAELDPGFPLFPVLLDQQSSAEDLENDFFGTLRINRTQCVTKVTTAAQILDGIKPKLGDHPAILRGTGTTPFQLLLETVESAITDQISLPNLQRLSERLFPETARPSTHAACASVLARHLLNKGKTSLQRFQDFLDAARPRPPRERAAELLKYLRALWVDAGACGRISAARLHGKCLALNGELVGHSEPELDTKCFTLDRYLERAWPGTDRMNVIQVSDAGDVDAIQNEIRRSYRKGSSTLSDDAIDDMVRQDPWHVVVFVPATALKGGVAPDARLVNDLERLQRNYRNPVFVFGLGVQFPEELPDTVMRVLPELSLETEHAQFSAEGRARKLLDKSYPYR
ncbi:MAG: TIR domain-containing protein [Candidatus Accumulibacter regalis]|jgi:hypothetical protein|uniref:toll/interleukin-1 receptor domain-containing protein n=1 Tax=Candidatus Accumulibacter sp. ACC005 TaxID=2823331 RepID=UPI0025C5DCB3|nr:toll/interleukin-1 receptor domain-containing protein [Candidatus Accumulibacter sp. ACC005]